MYIELLDKYEKERQRVELPNGQRRHDALFDFALWMDKQAAAELARLQAIEEAAKTVIESWNLYGNPSMQELGKLAARLAELDRP